MAALKVTISARELDPNVKYVPFRNEAVPFFPKPNPVKEVIVEPIKWKTEFLWKLAGFVLTSAVATMAFGDPTLAAGTMEAETLKTSQELNVMFDMFAKLLVAVGVGSSGVLLSAAGLYRMIRKDKESRDWTTDIIKGLVQVLLAGPTVMLLVYIATLLFGGSSWFVTPFLR